MAGAGFKTFNTGDVLTASDVNTYLMQQTVMVFASAAARTTALGANVAEGMLSYLKDTDVVEVYNGSAWVSSDDPNAIQNTIVDAKGDIITATAADTPARLAVGSNGYTLVADSSTSTGLAYSPTFFVGKNKIINGDFGIWQRGTSFSLTGASGEVYTADRWVGYVDGTTSATYSRQSFTAGTAPVTGYEGTFFARMAITSQSGGSGCYFYQKIEDVRTFANQTVTLSLWAKADTNRNVSLYAAQNFGSGGSAQVDSAAYTMALTTSWQRFTYSITLPSISGKTIGTGSSLIFYIKGAANTAQTIDIWGAQIEAGSTATQFQTATGTIQGELAACQRYYWRNTASAAYSNFGQGLNYSTTAAAFAFRFPVTMRIAPTATEISAISIQDYAGLGVAVTSPALEYASKDSAYLNVTGVSGLTANRPVFLGANNNSAAYVAFTAEL